MHGFRIYLKKRKLSTATVGLYTNYAQAFSTWLAQEGIEVDGVIYADMLAYIDSLRQKGLAVKSINGQLRAIGQYYDFLKSRNEVPGNPATNLVLKGHTNAIVHQLLSERQLEAIYASYEAESLSQYRNKLMLSLIVYQGLVLRELEKLEISHLKAEVIEIPATTGTNPRILALQPEEQSLLKQYLEEIRPIILAESGEVT